ncbi:hypothetical protein BGZ70_002250, partial [Mortierella alpina]
MGHASQAFRIRHLQNNSTKSFTTPTVVNEAFHDGTGQLLMSAPISAILYDIQQRRTISEVTTLPVKCVALHGVIAGFYLLALELLPHGDYGIIRTLEQPIYLTRIKGKNVHWLDRDDKTRAITMDPAESQLKQALAKRNYGEVLQLIRNSNVVGLSIMIAYLQKLQAAGNLNASFPLFPSYFGMRAYFWSFASFHSFSRATIFLHPAHPSVLRNTMENPLAMFCLVEGEAPSHAFRVSISSTATVSDLKDLIKAKKPNEFSDVDADKLTLWRVFMSPTNVNDDEVPVSLGTLTEKEKLRPISRLSKVFTERPPEEAIHIIVQRPPP